MGNAAPYACMGRDQMIEVKVSPDGSIEELDYPVKAKKLMSLYPNYLVIHCSTADPSPGQPRTVSVMDLEDLLIPGQAYILYPTPPEFKHCVPASQDRRMFVISGGSNSKKRGLQTLQSKDTKAMVPSLTRQRSLRVTAALLRCSIALLTGQPHEITQNGHQSPNLSEDENDTPVSKMEQNELEESDIDTLLFKKGVQKRKKKPGHLTLDAYMWRPDLDCIPESLPESASVYHALPKFPFAPKSFPRIPPPVPQGLGVGLEKGIANPMNPKTALDVSPGIKGSPMPQADHKSSNGFEDLQLIPDQNRGIELPELNWESLLDLRVPTQYNRPEATAAY